MSAASAPGFYGKVPGLGDFVSRRLPRVFVDYWDEWLQTVIAASRAQLGENWLNTYLSSPLWRFALSGGHCGADVWTGVLMPSVDRVGRYFPLTIATSLPATASPVAVVADASQWYEDAEALALSALEADDFDIQEFDAGVQGLGTPGYGTRQQQMHAGDPLSRAGVQVTLRAASDVADGYAGILHQLMSDRGVAFSVWSTEGSDLVEPGLLLCDALPTEHSFAALLDGQWSQWSWAALGGPADDGTDTDPAGMENSI